MGDSRPGFDPRCQAALAAAEQNRYWEFIENFYANQGIENSGYVTDDFLTEIANDAGVPDIDKWNADRESAAIAKQVEQTDAQARARLQRHPVVWGPGWQR